jgi:hypothetical protein
MKKVFTSVIGLMSVIGAAGLYVMRRIQTHSDKILNRVADAGYETAHDILFPNEDKKEKKQHYGPVLPDS